jgi:hypothetical protein
MRTATVEVFQFAELAPRAKETARAWYREGALDHAWWDLTVEDAKTCFALIGFDIKDIPFSGFSSQGDGASFNGTWTASDVKPGELKEHAPEDKELHRIAGGIETIAKQLPNAFFRVKNTGRYCHEYATNFDFDFPDDAPIEEIRTAEEELTTLARAAMKWTYRQLEKEYEYQSSDEQVDVSIEANEYEFTKDGKRWTR